MKLEPLEAATLAEDVYALTKELDVTRAIRLLNVKYDGQLTFSPQQLLKGKTGGPFFFKSRTAFGFTLLGQDAFKGQAFIIFRGTQYLADWLTNFNLSVSGSTSGMPLHDGFNKAFGSMKSALTEFIAEANKAGITTIHCIGHSLGGALATICADWLYVSYKIKPYVYTFGSPRVGLEGFSSQCTRNVGAKRIFRVYHKTDIVPCLPIWPFLHTPLPGRDYYVPSPGIIPMVEYHGMDRYVESMSKATSWKNLSSRPEQITDAGIVIWLKQSTPVGLSITSTEWLGRALAYVLKQCMHNTAIVISRSFSTTFTLLDQLAYILRAGVDLSKNASSLVLLLIRKIMQILGMRKVVEIEELTREFIRSILLRLHARVAELGRNALSKVLVDGRAV